MDPERQKHPPARRSREISRTLVWLCLLAAGIFVAWLVHRWLRREGPASPHSTDAPNRGPLAPATGPAGVTGLLGASRDPARMAGLVAIDRDPQNLPAPPGALRRWAFRRERGGIVQELAVYDHAPAVQGVIDHYAGALTKRGFRRVRLPSSVGAARRVSFRKEQMHVVISLRKHGKDAKLVRVRVVVTRYGPP